MSDIFDLLDDSIESLADLEKFEPLWAGTHTVNVSFEEKEVNNLPAVDMQMTLVETLELADASQPMQEPGKKAGILFLLKKKDKQTQEVVPNKMGQGQLKEVLMILAEQFPGASMREVMNNANGAQVTVTLKVRKNKEDPDQMYNSIKALLVG